MVLFANVLKKVNNKIEMVFAHHHLLAYFGASIKKCPCWCYAILKNKVTRHDMNNSNVMVVDPKKHSQNIIS